VQAALHRAWRHWRNQNRSIDLFVRSGSRDRHDLYYLFKSVETFWPRGVGNVILVLDKADMNLPISSFIDVRSKQVFKVYFEQAPCMPGRVFNQISYMMADYYSSADTIVTVDSDCIFHAPVTPNLLFDKDGKILFPWKSHVSGSLDGITTCRSI